MWILSFTPDSSKHSFPDQHTIMSVVVTLPRLQTWPTLNYGPFMPKIIIQVGPYFTFTVRICLWKCVRCSKVIGNFPLADHLNVLSDKLSQFSAQPVESLSEYVGTNLPKERRVTVSGPPDPCEPFSNQDWLKQVAYAFLEQCSGRSTGWTTQIVSHI